MWLRFTQGIAANPVNGDWNRLILTNVLLPDALKTIITRKLSTRTTTCMSGVNEIPVARRNTTLPLHKGPTESAAGFGQVLLPSFFPIASYGDTPGVVKIPITNSMATVVISECKCTSSHTPYDNHSNFLVAIFDSPSISLWLSAMMENPTF